MTEISNLVVSHSRKVQLDKFEPIEHSVTFEVIPEDGENLEEAYQNGARLAEDMVDREIVRRTVAHKEESED